MGSTIACTLRGELSSVGAVTNNWANLLSEWGRIPAEPELAELRMNAAMDLYAQIIRSDAAVGDQKGLAFYNRGVRYGQRGDWIMPSKITTASCFWMAQPRR